MQNITRAQFIASVFIFIFSFGTLQAAVGEIGMEGWEFGPAELIIVEGETAVWFNNDDTNHDIAFETEFENAPTLDKPHKVRATKRYSLTFNKAGVYKYFCKIHRDYDMKGAIIVKEVDK